MIVGFDIDDVLYPWVPIVNEIALLKWGVDVSSDWSDWSGARVILGEDFNWLFSVDGCEATLGQFDRCYRDTVEVARLLIKAGHEVHFVTHRDPGTSSSLTGKFLETHFGDLSWAGTHVLGHGTRKCDLKKWDLFVDDKPQTCLEMAGGGTRVYAPNRSWNTELKDNPEVVMYNYPVEIVEDLMGLVDTPVRVDPVFRSLH